MIVIIVIIGSIMCEMMLSIVLIGLVGGLGEIMFLVGN